jgi:hypothetical protein
MCTPLLLLCVGAALLGMDGSCMQSWAFQALSCDCNVTCSSKKAGLLAAFRHLSQAGDRIRHIQGTQAAGSGCKSCMM